MLVRPAFGNDVRIGDFDENTFIAGHAVALPVQQAAEGGKLHAFQLQGSIGEKQDARVVGIHVGM
jgi:hypothetical protein